MKWPSAKLVRRVIKHLEKDLGVSVYGGSTNLETGEQGPGCRDFNADHIIKLRKLVRANKLWHGDD